MGFTKLAREVFTRGAHCLHAHEVRREQNMKPLWAQTLAWIAAALAAVLLAMANPDNSNHPFDGYFTTPLAR